MVFCIKSIFHFKHTILKLCWANSHKVMSMILTSRYSPLASFSTNLEMKRQESTSVHIIAFITFCINEMFNPFTPISDQGRISHYSINRISSRLMTRIKELQSTHRWSNSLTPTRQRIKSSRDIGELVLNPIQLIRS